MAKVLHAGALREMVEIEKPSASRDATGGQTTRYDRVALRRAQVTPISGSEKTTAASVQALTVYDVLIRYFAGLTTLYRMKWTPAKESYPRTLNIESIVNVDGRGEWMVLSCTEKT